MVDIITGVCVVLLCFHIHGLVLEWALRIKLRSSMFTKPALHQLSHLCSPDVLIPSHARLWPGVHGLSWPIYNMTED